MPKNPCFIPWNTLRQQPLLKYRELDLSTPNYSIRGGPYFDTAFSTEVNMGEKAKIKMDKALNRLGEPEKIEITK